MNDWRIETGLTSPKTKEIWELTGRCEKDCCKKAAYAEPQHIRQMKANHGWKYWRNFYINQMEEPVFRHAVGFDGFIKSITTGALIEDPECPYIAARRYRQSLGLLHAIYEYFRMSSDELEKLVKHLKSNPFLDKHDSWWFIKSI